MCLVVASRYLAFVVVASTTNTTVALKTGVAVEARLLTRCIRATTGRVHQSDAPRTAAVVPPTCGLSPPRLSSFSVLPVPLKVR